MARKDIHTAFDSNETMLSDKIATLCNRVGIPTLLLAISAYCRLREIQLAINTKHAKVFALDSMDCRDLAHKIRDRHVKFREGSDPSRIVYDKG